MRTTPPVRLRALILAVTLVLTLAAPVSAGAGGASAASDEVQTRVAGGVPVGSNTSDNSAPDDPATVTLVTGDRVTLVPTADGEPEVIVDPAGGSPRTGFDVLRDGTHVHVVPDDVSSLVPGVLDPALFDVTGLVEMGYDDRGTDQLPLIVRTAPRVRRTAEPFPMQTVQRLGSIDAAAVQLDKDDAAAFGDDLAAAGRGHRLAASALGGVTKIWLDRRVEAAALDGYLTQVKAPAAWEAGLDGTGTRVAVLDTGVDDGHPALAGQIDAHANFTDGPSPADGHGHGTHVASLVGGTGAGSDGARQGIAPGADLLSGKVLADDGFGQESWVIAGMQWAVANGADVVNLSLGGAPTATDDPLVQSLDSLTAQSGALFVVAAGNRGGVGTNPFTIETPGSAASALTVGAASPTDFLAIFSSEGPTLGTYRLKPDVVAPGVGILGARAGARDTDLYLPMSGTSQATPIVAGAASLLIQQHPDWTWQQIKTQIVGTADQNPQFHTSWSHGGGRLDLDQATHQDLTADVPTLGFGYLRHPDDAPKTRTVTLTNDGTEPVSVSITDMQSSDTGLVAPDDAVVASPASLTVPAGGTASTTVTLDPSLLEDGLWQGGMSFNSDDTTLLRLPFGVYDEPERYDLDVQVLDRNGDPYDPATGADDPNGDTTIPMFDADNGFFYRLRPDENGHASARVAPGNYMIFARIITAASGGQRETFSIAGDAGLEVRSDTSYVIDARDAVRLRPPTVQGQQTDPRVVVGVTYSRHSDTRGYTEFGFFDPQEVADGRVYITPTDTADNFESTFRWRLAPTGKVKPKAPDEYDLLLNAPRFPDPLSPHLSSGDVADLAHVDKTYRPIGAPGEYLAGTIYQTVETGIGFITRTPQQVPGTTRVLMTANPDVQWGHCMTAPANANLEMCDDSRSYQRSEPVAVQFGATLHPEMFAARHSPSSMFLQTGISDGQHSRGLAPSAVESTRLTVFKDGVQVESREAVSGFFPLPDEAGRFRIEQQWTLRDTFTGSREARTIWTFDSAPPADPSQRFSTTPPFLTLDYGAELDPLGRADPRRPLRLNLAAGHLTGADAPDRIDTMRLWWSVDGGDSWQQAPTIHTGTASFTGVVPGTGLQSGDTVSLRVVATDAAGNEVDQTVLQIIPVR